LKKEKLKHLKAPKEPILLFPRPKVGLDFVDKKSEARVSMRASLTRKFHKG
jgi:hypothetical protein